MLTIKVKGNILATECNHNASNWVCHSVSDTAEIKGKNWTEFSEDLTIPHDIVLTKSVKTIPYAIYLAERGISLKDGDNKANITAYGDNTGAVFANLNEAIEEIKVSAREIKKLGEDIRERLYRLLYIEAYSAFELFLCDSLMSRIFACDENYLKAKKYFHNKQNSGNKVGKETINAQTIEKDEYNYLDAAKVFNYYVNNIVYHRFDKVANAFKEILHIDLPENQLIFNFFLRKRHNIVHRYSYSNFTRMKITQITEDDLTKLISAIQNYANNVNAL